MEQHWFVKAREDASSLGLLEKIMLLPGLFFSINSMLEKLESES